VEKNKEDEKEGRGEGEKLYEKYIGVGQNDQLKVSSCTKFDSCFTIKLLLSPNMNKPAERIQHSETEELFLFDLEEILALDAKQDENLDRIETLLEDRSVAKQEGIRVMDSAELEEARVMYFQTHDEYMMALEQINVAKTTNHQKNLPLAVDQFKVAHADLEKAFQQYMNALKRSYQN
jgi:hypothetical protein